MTFEVFGGDLIQRTGWNARGGDAQFLGLVGVEAFGEIGDLQRLARADDARQPEGGAAIVGDAQAEAVHTRGIGDTHAQPENSVARFVVGGYLVAAKISEVCKRVYVRPGRSAVGG